MITLFVHAGILASEPYFYDADNSCSLGCACSWDIIQPKGSVKLGESTPVKPDEDSAPFSKCILIELKHDVPFTGFSIDSGSFDGKPGCTTPMKYEITVNDVSVSLGSLKDTRERQCININPIIIHNGDVIGLNFITGHKNGEKIGITYLTPNGAH
jgi:hypothetical protein